MKGLLLLKKFNFKFIVLTNQSGIVWGYLSETKLSKIHQFLDSLLDKHGITIHAYFYCPHHPENLCQCRKPSLGYDSLQNTFPDVDPLKGWMIGDKSSDIELGKKMNMQTILLQTGKGKESIHKALPSWYCRSMKDAANITVQNHTIFR